MQLLLLGPFLPLGIVYALIAGVGVWINEQLFWGMSICALLTGIWCIIALKRVKRLELLGLSPKAQLLFDKYNSAWAAPALTRVSRLYLSLGQYVCISASIHFVFESDWLKLLIVALLFLYNGHYAVTLDPTMYIKLHHLGDEAHEIASAYTESQKPMP